MAASIVTKTARKNLAMARAGEISLPHVTHMVFGDGGVDADGNPIQPGEEDTTLKHEVLRKVVESHSFPTDTSCRYGCSVLKTDVVDKINEIGLIDSAGNLVVIKTFKNKYRDEEIEMIFEIEDKF